MERLSMSPAATRHARRNKRDSRFEFYGALAVEEWQAPEFFPASVLTFATAGTKANPG